jgi:hypothetical protein
VLPATPTEIGCGLSGLSRTLADFDRPPQHLRQLGEVRRHTARARPWRADNLGGLAGAALAVEFRRNVLARLAMRRAQPLQKPVNVVVVEDAGQR